MKHNSEQTNKNKQKPIYVGIGLILGAAAGFSLGMGNPLSAAVGAAVGLILGAGLDAAQKGKGA